ncbi:hypothetical protein EXIGLDRAFT_775948 [Exidia glandulosa HHB12029]|uniref:Uncharacterized protein n=1 Tax=Exidia glandulosa HHB12029 TaxID=1314781 RepID=A0A165DNZ7_EXIGL|nr:hypothetical protein EXIGLDRAFT_775948 [Exidia glandulosa HHB12029]
MSSRRRDYQPATRAPLTADERAIPKARNGELEARMDGVADYINRETKAIAEELGKTVAWVRGRMFAGSKGAAFLRRSRASNNVRVYDAYMHWKCKQIHADEERTTPLTLKELKLIVRDEEPHYKDRPREEQDMWIADYKADMKAKNTKRRVNRKAEQQDATFTCKHIASEIETLEMRTGVKGFYSGVRSDMLQSIQPFFTCTQDISQFLNIVLGKTPDQIVSLFEMWAIGGLRGVYGVNAKNSLEIKSEVRRVIQSGLDKILIERYGVGKAPPKFKMNYKTYDNSVVATHAVRLVGWTFDGGIINPGDVKPVEELRKLYDALLGQDCHWEVVPVDERTEPTAKKRKRTAPTSDAEPNKRGKAAAAKKKKTRAPTPSESWETDDDDDDDE